MERTAEDLKRLEHFKKMVETPVSRLVLHLAFPTIISMLITSIYNMADTFFVAQLGTSAAGAVGIVFSIMAIFQAIGFTIGQGGGAHVAKLLGQKRDKEAQEMASTAFFSGLFMGIVLCCLGLTFLDSLMKLLGATDTILPYAKEYARYIFLAAPVMMASFIMNNILRSEGKASYAMIGITAGGILNIILDPIFIFTTEELKSIAFLSFIPFGFGFKTAGAAMATAISQCISFVLLLSMFICGKSNVKFSIRKVSLKVDTYLSILKAGLPSLSRQGLASIASVALNVNAATFGDAAVAAMSIANRVTFLIFSALLGFGQGFQPVAGFNWGAKRYERVYSSTKFTAIVGTSVITVLSIICFIAAPSIIAVFRKDDLEVIAIGARALRAQCLVLPLTGISVTTNMALQSTLHSGKATFLAMLRQGICFLPCITLLPIFIGLNGVIFAQSIADVFTMAISLIFFIAFLKELKSFKTRKI